ncbi:hypothetical protein KUL156_59330 [Alteromonas sp. KUL156]|nr:DUF6146 family protein [Tenacibaculum mesophilum]GFD75607.1 hypothetical protein KUL113_50270 [Tenacibaculum sp. KUL113]GFD94850.1 hypothetical protein KUL154_35830 [Alteromonas sp. KUL154]GFE03341.1 hypothetical protein KUL156_59330 [Alteromonas sp. KUL156]
MIWACSSSPIKNTSNTPKEEPVVIANDSLEYEIIIIDPGFTTYLNSIAKPEGFYSQQYLENKNRLYVNTWNYRARNPLQFNSNIYENVIDYSPHVDYGYEVNYKLFNYFEFAQRKYRMNLGVGINRWN